MIRSELPDNWQDLATGYILGNLSDEEVALWNRMVQDYPDLATELETYQATFHLFADAVPMVPPPDSLLHKIRSQAQTTSDAVELPPSPGTWKPQALSEVNRSRGKPGFVGIGAIAATLIAALGWQLHTTTARLQQAKTTIQSLEQELQEVRSQAQTLNPVISTLQQPETRIYNLQGSDLATTASGRLVLADDQDVLIVVKNLPSLPADQVYRLWADLPTESALTYCGQFNSNREGFISLRPVSTQCGQNPTQMLITIDAVSDPTTRGGPVVMQGQI